MKLWIALFLCAVALSPRTAWAQSPTTLKERPADGSHLKTPLFVWASAVAADQLTTYRFASRYRDVIHEDNPLTAGLDRHPVLLVAAGTAIDATTGWLSYRLLRTHPRLAKIAFYSAAAYRTYLAAHNIRLMQNAAVGVERARAPVSVSMGFALP